MKRYGVIMAGGGGTRFWPLSRKSLPKQFLNLTGKDIMVNETIDRLTEVILKEDFFIVTNQAHADLTFLMAAGRLQKDHILAEPAARNTAACTGYAAMEIVRKYGDGVMCIFPSDHYIRNTDAFARTIEQAAELAEETGKLITIGIKPTYPATGYGYIRKKKHSGMEVQEFVEKPDLETAKEYIASGNYLWNSGMFVWKASVILEHFKELLPDIYACLEKIGKAMKTPKEQQTIAKIYPTIPKISIDYGIMERARDVLVRDGDFGWDEVGSWETLDALYKPDADGNVIRGEHIGVDTKNCISYSDGKLIATVGVCDLVIVETKDAVLVCDKKRAQDVRKIVETLEEQGKTEYL
ncbi:MAG: mannose-1-phosphate guanylyltransferase [Lachnospiraceae bacterium]|nr:mannose-1-phosphate guanylyltransferase [Lachnospiraceae bacterium]